MATFLGDLDVVKSCLKLSEPERSGPGILQALHITAKTKHADHFRLLAAPPDAQGDWDEGRSAAVTFEIMLECDWAVLVFPHGYGQYQKHAFVGGQSTHRTKVLRRSSFVTMDVREAYPQPCIVEVEMSLKRLTGSARPREIVRLDIMHGYNDTTRTVEDGSVTLRPVSDNEGLDLWFGDNPIDMRRWNDQGILVAPTVDNGPCLMLSSWFIVVSNRGGRRPVLRRSTPNGRPRSDATLKRRPDIGLLTARRTEHEVHDYFTHQKGSHEGYFTPR